MERCGGWAVVAEVRVKSVVKLQEIQPTNIPRDKETTAAAEYTGMHTLGGNLQVIRTKKPFSGNLIK